MRTVGLQVGKTLDAALFGDSLAKSDDLQSDAMRAARGDLNAYVDAAQQARYESRRDIRAGAGSLDVLALQSAAGLENLAVYTYRTALALPFIGGSGTNSVLKAFATKTMAQHAAHGRAFNAAATKLGGRNQSGTDARYTPVVRAAAAKFKGPLDVIGLALTVEDLAAQTYVRNIGLLGTSDLRALFASVAGVESQHKAVLLVVQALMNTGGPQLIALPPDLAKLPGAAGDVGFPDAFFPTDRAAALAPAAVK